MFHANMALLVAAIASLSFVTATSIPPSHQLDRPSENSYRDAHSLGDNYKFSTESGWNSVNVSDLGYKYSRDSMPPVNTRSKNDNKAKAKSYQSSRKPSVIGDAVVHLLNDVWNGLRGVGEPEPVEITWYTGHDLLNPSCWSHGKWAPTDQSFACALTLEGWTTRPKCFSFLELCNTPKKCIFVRVLDSCAGCKPGSKHVDLTKAAFSALADLDQGALTVQMRAATDPKEWYEDLWGPKMK